MDIIQECFEQYVQTEDPAFLERAVAALYPRWKWRIRSFLQSASAEEVEDMLHSAIEELAMPTAERMVPRACAPAGAWSSAGWRSRVLHRWVIDRSRKRGRRVHALKGAVDRWSPKTEREEWRRQKRIRVGLERETPFPREAPALYPHQQSFDELLSLRQCLVRALPSIAVRRRVLVALSANMDPTPWISELAIAIGDTPDAVAGRMYRALDAPPDGLHDWFTEADVRVVYPAPKPLAKALESARRALQRAWADIQERCT